MKALRLRELSGPSGLEFAEVDTPSGENQVLISVEAAGVGFPDLLLTQGLYQMKVDLPFVPGSEVAGSVISAPAESGFEPGDRVCAFTTIGGFAQTVAADASMTLPLDDGLSARSAARMVSNYQTAFYSLAIRAQIGPGETVLVFGAGGGLGGALADVATALGAEAIGVDRTPEKRAAAIQAGCRAAFAPDDEMVAAIRTAAPDGIDVALDPVGGDLAKAALRLLSPGGRLVILGFASGSIPSIEANRILIKNLDVIGSVWGEAVTRDPSLPASIWIQITELLESGSITPPGGPEFPLERGAEALEALLKGTLDGRAVLIPPA